MRGENAAILCYGPTGTGKTHTMVGPQRAASHAVAKVLDPAERREPSPSPDTSRATVPPVNTSSPASQQAGAASAGVASAGAASAGAASAAQTPQAATSRIVCAAARRLLGADSQGAQDYQPAKATPAAYAHFGPDEGLVSRICQALFARVNAFDSLREHIDVQVKVDIQQLLSISS